MSPFDIKKNIVDKFSCQFCFNLLNIVKKKLGYHYNLIIDDRCIRYRNEIIKIKYYLFILKRTYTCLVNDSNSLNAIVIHSILESYCYKTSIKYLCIIMNCGKLFNL